MKLKKLVKSLDDVPEQFRELYEQTDDGFVLSGIEDGDFKAKLAEFRDNNVSLNKRVEELTKQIDKFKDVDPEMYEHLLDLKKKLESNEETKLLADGKWEEVLNRRTKGLRDSLENKISQLEKLLAEKDETIGKTTSELNRIQIETRLTEALNAKDVPKPKEGAVPDIIRRTHDVYRYDDEGNLVAVDNDGNQRFGKNGKEFTFEEHLLDLADHASHLFEGGAGGGAGGSEGGRPRGKTISRSDPNLVRYADKIASGEMEVVD